MMIKRISGFTRIIGQSQGYIGLPLRDEVIVDAATGLRTPAMVTAWEPTPKELQRLLHGEPIYLRVLGNQHPPVSIWVGKEGE